jgi:methylated-DNA-[protein]-cysteine S-methyltransferase
VGQALAKNPLPIVVPCHRVIGKDGDLTGFEGGLELKKSLLEIEASSRS